jgi:hypothetical protein
MEQICSSTVGLREATVGLREATVGLREATVGLREATVGLRGLASRAPDLAQALLRPFFKSTPVYRPF